MRGGLGSCGPDRIEEDDADRSAHRRRRLPGLNAVIRAVVRKGVADVRATSSSASGTAGAGRWRTTTMPLGIDQVRGILPRGGTILGSSRTNPFKVDGGVERISENLHERRGRADRDRRRGHPRRRHAAARARGQRRRRAEDHRQRPEGHRLHVRLRHRGEHRDGGDRPAAHHRRVAPPGAGRRGDGPARRLDRAARRHGRRRQRDPHPRAAVRRDRSATTSRAGSRRHYSPIIVVAEGATPRRRRR